MTDKVSSTLSVVVPVFNERFLVKESVRRLAAVELPYGMSMEIVLVDDGSTDGTLERLQELKTEFGAGLILHRHEKNRGKGAAVRTGIDLARGDLVAIHDADLEYEPKDLGRLVKAFVEDGADVVYGSRFLAAERRRVLYFSHSLGNRIVTFLSNVFTDLGLTDVETCYKMFKGELIRSIPIRSEDFGFEVEITAKIAKRGSIVYEVPISYHGRTYREGKKISWTDGVRALATILRFWIWDDLYKNDPVGGAILHRLERARRFNAWMAESLSPWIGSEVLEIGAGIGTMTRLFCPRDFYLASDINPSYLAYLRNMSIGRPYLAVAKVDLEDEADFASLRERFDTVVCLNVLEHMRDPEQCLRNLRSALRPGGRIVLYVPGGQWLYSPIDDALGHLRRYSSELLRGQMERAGLKVTWLRQFNKSGVLGWFVNGKILRRRAFGRWQLKAFNAAVPLLRAVDRFLPWSGLGWICVAERTTRMSTVNPLHEACSADLSRVRGRSTFRELLAAGGERPKRAD